MIIRCDVPYFTQRPLTMGAIKRDEASKLIPAGLKFTPFLEVFILLTCSVEQLLGSHIALLHTESALVHAPEGNTSHREIQSGSHLRTHVFPTCTDITAPCGGGITLQRSEERRVGKEC